MFEKKEDAIYKRYYLGGKCVWKKQKSAKEMFMSIINEMNGHCAGMQATLRKNTRKIIMPILKLTGFRYRMTFDGRLAIFPPLEKLYKRLLLVLLSTD